MSILSFSIPFAGVSSTESSFGFLGQSNIYKCECHAFSIHACSMNTGCKKIKCYLGLARLSVSQSVLVRMLLWLYSMLLWLYCMLLRQYSGFHIQLFSSGGDKSSMGGGDWPLMRGVPPLKMKPWYWMLLWLYWMLLWLNWMLLWLYGMLLWL